MTDSGNYPSTVICRVVIDWAVIAQSGMATTRKARVIRTTLTGRLMGPSARRARNTTTKSRIFHLGVRSQRRGVVWAEYNKPNGHDRSSIPIGEEGAEPVGEEVDGQLRRE